MGWRDRDWARLDDSERKRLYAPSGSVARPYRRGRGLRLTSAWVGLAAAISASVYVAGHYPRGHPLIPALGRLHLPAPTAVHAKIATSAADYGSIETLTGRTPGAQSGPVEADGSWNRQPWQLLATSRASGGTYRVRFTIGDHGTLKLRVRYPGGEADGTILVP
jgi:hypothetical protein